MICDHFKDEVEGNKFFTPGWIAACIKKVFVELKDQPGSEFMGGEKVPDGMAFKSKDNGSPYPTAGNLSIAFVRLGVTFRYNVFTDRYLIDGLEGFGPELDDAAINRLRFDIDRKYKFLVDEKMMRDFCKDFARYYSFDPVIEYFDKVQNKWDRKERIDTFFIDYAGAEDTPYVREVSKLLFLSIVRRNRTPGAKYDEMIVLEFGARLGQIVRA